MRKERESDEMEEMVKTWEYREREGEETKEGEN